MFMCTLQLAFVGTRATVRARLNSLDEAAIWQAEWVNLGFQIVQETVGPPMDLPRDRLIADKPGPAPEKTEPLWIAYARWAALCAVERFRTRRTWEAQHQICEDVDPPYGEPQ
jgi:hypothetical protein